MTETPQGDTHLVHFALREMCENGRAAFQSQISFFSFFAAANAVAVGWLLRKGGNDDCIDDDQCIFAFFFLLANLIVSIVLSVRAREIHTEAICYSGLLGELTGKNLHDRLAFSFPHKRYERTTLAMSLMAILLLGGWVFAYTEGWQVRKPYSCLGGIAAALIVALWLGVIPRLLRLLGRSKGSEPDLLTADTSLGQALQASKACPYPPTSRIDREPKPEI
ncbi:MAG: hypothetical protein JW818_16620 [Pirellulales bacterium]|nr:hypothetical protein [Pirellulales bacterium]